MSRMQIYLTSGIWKDRKNIDLRIIREEFDRKS